MRLLICLQIINVLSHSVKNIYIVLNKDLNNAVVIVFQKKVRYMILTTVILSFKAFLNFDI